MRDTYWRLAMDFIQSTMKLDLSVTLELRQEADGDTACGFHVSDVPASGKVIHAAGSSGDRLWASSDWSEARVYTTSPDSLSALDLLLRAVYTNLARNRSALLLHAAVVEYQGRTVLFSGPSGIGKTTHAVNWVAMLDAVILNGDKSFLCRKDGVIYGYGSPWCGSSPYSVNRGAPLKGIMVLRQAETNVIRRLSHSEALPLLMSQIYWPYWDKQALDSAMGMLDDILCNIPVWLLECRPDAEAVLMARDTVFGGLSNASPACRVQAPDDFDSMDLKSMGCA